jgi:histidinol dehydrogenase
MQPGFHVATLSPTLHLVQYDPMKMSSDLSALQIQRVDARQGSAEILQELRLKLSPQGDVVSPRGRALTEEVFGEALTPVEVVQKICRDVREDGTEALLRYNKALDKADLSAEQLRVPQSELEAAHSAADPALLDSVRRIRDNVAEFQQAILHSDVTLKPRPGVSLTQRYLPLKRIGVCVPGGAAAYPSTVLMTAVPAQVAGVEEIAVVAPPTKFGAYNVDMLATCHELGLREVYRVGGAQAVAALAYGCNAIPAVDKIVGPGNLFVALAKKEAYGVVDIDSFAGPSEVIVIADETARADFVAADLLAQAEHSPGSAILITWNETLIDAVYEELIKQLALLSRNQLTFDSLEAFGALILVRDQAHACELTDHFAPEHLHIETRNPREEIVLIRNSGAAFLGHHTPVALGDYAAGPSHVLPTGGTCTWAAGLSSNSFLRSSSVTEFDSAAMNQIASDVVRLADKEGLTAHARSVTIRES